MDVGKEREKICRFFKAGVFSLSLVLLIGCTIRYLPKAMKTWKEVSEEGKFPIECVACKEKKVALSFEVKGTDKDVEEILSILDKEKIRATFFVTGDWVKQYPEAVQVISQSGSDIGNSGENYQKMNEMSSGNCIEEVLGLHKQVRELTGTEMKLFRAPYGDYSETLIHSLDSLGYYPIEGNIDSLDWKDYGKDAIVNEICNNEDLKEGSIIKLHTGTKFTGKALNAVIDTLQKKGYQLVRVSDIVLSDGYIVNSDGCQISKLE